MLSALAFSLADIRLNSMLIIPAITKTEYSLLTPKTCQVYPKKWNTYGMDSKKWIICVAPDNTHTSKSRNYGRKVSLKNAKNFNKLQVWNFTERLQVSEVCPWLSRGEGRVEIQKTLCEKKYGYFLRTKYWCDVHIIYKTNLKLYWQEMTFKGMKGFL